MSITEKLAAAAVSVAPKDRLVGRTEYDLYVAVGSDVLWVTTSGLSRELIELVHSDWDTDEANYRVSLKNPLYVRATDSCVDLVLPRGAWQSAEHAAAVEKLRAGVAEMLTTGKYVLDIYQDPYAAPTGPAVEYTPVHFED